MNEWTSWQVHRFNPMQNYVMTTPVYQTDVVKIGQLELYQDTTYNPALHQPIVQRVISVPKNLIYGRMRVYVELDKGWDDILRHNRTEMAAIDRPVPNCMPWRTTMDLRRDDMVYVDSFSLATADKENRCIRCDGQKFYLIPYDCVYFKIVDGRPEMINGWILVEPVDAPEDPTVTALKKSGLEFPGITITNDNRREMGVVDKLGIIRHIGPPVDEYIDDIEEIDDVNTGDVVVFKWGHNRRLESASHRFFGQTDLIVTRRPRLVGVMREDLF
jgi:hypothetical protein